MSKFNVTVGVEIKQAGQPFMGPVNVPWFNVSGDHLDALMKSTDKAGAAAAKAAGKGGPISVTLSRSATALDGGTVPQGFNLNKSFDGLTFDGLNDFQDASHDSGKDLRKLGREHAKKKGRGRQ